MFFLNLNKNFSFVSNKNVPISTQQSYFMLISDCRLEFELRTVAEVYGSENSKSNIFLAINQTSALL